MDYNFAPTLSLALFDFVPCILYIVAFVYLLRFARRNARMLFFYLMFAGMVIVEIGALFKVMWKLLNAAISMNITELNDYSMYFIGIGTLIIFISVVNLAMRERNIMGDKHPSTTMYTIPLFVPVIILLSLSTSGYLICLIMLAFARKNTVSVYMFTIYLVLSFVMAGFTPGGYSQMTHWICEIVNTFGTLAFVIGTYNLNKSDYLMKQKQRQEG